jgi:hypothetical protein
MMHSSVSKPSQGSHSTEKCKFICCKFYKHLLTIHVRTHNQKFLSFTNSYYEGKEFETKLKEKKPGLLSDELKTALSIPPLAPPPWLINMQRFGPPPSYPSLRIAGLNAPIPEGAQWGYHPGGWGRPPIDEVCI